MTKLLAKAGCCGFRSTQSEYAALFSVVEVQHTFYQPPQIATLERWRAAAPKNFEFTIKAWQLITHEARSPTYRRLKRELTDEERAGCGAFRLTPIVREAWDVTRACANALKATRVLFQCPASFKPTPENLKRMRAFFSTIERGKLRFYWEPRGLWAGDVVRGLCDELDLVHVVDPFSARTVTTARERYFRLHGRGGNWRYQYETSELEELLTMLPRGKTSYVFFNNVRMHEDAARFQELVHHPDA